MLIVMKQHRLASEHVGVVVEIGVYILLDVGVLSVELVVLRALRRRKRSVL